MDDLFLGYCSEVRLFVGVLFYVWLVLGFFFGAYGDTV